MCPPVGVSSRFMQRRNVDLPEPDGPITQTTSPLRIWVEILVRTFKSPNALERSLMSIITSPFCTLSFILSQAPFQILCKVVEDHRQRQINSSHYQKRCPRVIRSGTDDIAALRQILHRHVTGYRSLFQKNNKLIAKCRKYVFKCLRHNDIAHRLHIVKTKASTCLHLSLVDRHDTGTEDLRYIRCRVKTKRDHTDKDASKYTRYKNTVVENHQLDDNRRSPDDRQIYLADTI